MFQIIAFVLSTIATAAVALLVPTNKVWFSLLAFVAAYVACFLLFWLVTILLALFVNKKKEHVKYNAFYHNFLAFMIEYVCSFVRVKTIVSGAEKIPKDCRFLLVANHVSNFDPLLTYAALRKYRLAYISKTSNFRIPVAGALMYKNGFLALNRTDPREGMKTIINAQKRIESGEYSIAVYPEGTRNKTQELLLPFKSGSFKIAQRADVPVVIACTKNTQKIHKNFPWRKTVVSLEILDVIQPQNFANTQEMAEYAQQKIAACLTRTEGTAARR